MSLAMRKASVATLLLVALLAQGASLVGHSHDDNLHPSRIGLAEFETPSDRDGSSSSTEGDESAPCPLCHSVTSLDFHNQTHASFRPRLREACFAPARRAACVSLDSILGRSQDPRPPPIPTALV